MYPSLEEVMTGLVDGIVALSSQKLRLLRHGFTQIGLTIFKELLVEACKLQTLKGYFGGQGSAEKEHIRKIDGAINFFINKSAEKLGVELLKPRLVDP